MFIMFMEKGIIRKIFASFLIVRKSRVIFFLLPARDFFPFKYSPITREEEICLPEMRRMCHSEPVFLPITQSLFGF